MLTGAGRLMVHMAMTTIRSAGGLADTACGGSQSETLQLVEREGGASKAALLEAQRSHLCTDCGHVYLTDEYVPDGPYHRRQIFGGGSIVTSLEGPVREVHILPHGGTEFPQDFLAEASPNDFPALSNLAHENSDIGTGAIYRELVNGIVSGRSRGVVVAGFHFSRLLIDANRAKTEEQLPAAPYIGRSDIYSDYIKRQGHTLREQALLPWLDAIDEILHTMGGEGVVYHHHTYDVRSMSPRPWDLGSRPERPPFQLVWKKPTWEATPDPTVLSAEDDVVALQDIRDVRDQIGEFLAREMGVTDGRGGIDYPLQLPAVPFLGARVGDSSDTPRHVCYDLRKDILLTDEHVRAWVEVAPWRLNRLSRKDPHQHSSLRLVGSD